MKLRDLLKHLHENGCEFLREGGNHSVYVNRVTALTDPRSSLNARARALAAMVEKATGKPTYTHLFRHYALPGDTETTRPCPLCGSSWKVEGEVFHFRCEPCRLTSNLGPASGQDEHEDALARIGTWQGDS